MIICLQPVVARIIKRWRKPSTTVLTSYRQMHGAVLLVPLGSNVLAGVVATGSHPTESWRVVISHLRSQEQDAPQLQCPLQS